MKSEITQEYLKSIFHFDEKQGRLIWKSKMGIRGAIGRPAGYLLYGYRVIQINGKAYREHRLIWMYAHGSWPVAEIDHINHVRDDNRLVNLRSVSKGTNMKNKSSYVNNKSGITGVIWSSECKKWMAYITVMKKRFYLGLFSSIEDAAKVRKEAEMNFNFHHNHGEK